MWLVKPSIKTRRSLDDLVKTVYEYPMLMLMLCWATEEVVEDDAQYKLMTRGEELAGSREVPQLTKSFTA